MCKQCDQQGINLQNIPTVHAAQYQNKQLSPKNGQKIQTDIFPKKTYYNLKICMHLNVQCNIIYNSQDRGATYTGMDRWKDK